MAEFLHEGDHATILEKPIIWIPSLEVDGDSIAVHLRWQSLGRDLTVTNDRVGRESVLVWLAQHMIEKSISVGGGIADAAAVIDLLGGEDYTVRRMPGVGAVLTAPAGVMTDGLQVTLALKGLGWLRVQLKVADQQVQEYMAGWMTPGWADTLTGVTAALVGTSPVVIVWSEEPGCHQLVLRPAADGSCVCEIRFLRDALFGDTEHPEAGETVQSWSMPTRSLAVAFATASRNLVAAHPGSELAIWWGQPAPQEELGTLESAITGVFNQL